MKQVEYKKNYIVYEDGRVWIKKANRFAKLSNSDGYLLVNINGRTEKVHRVVATCFIPNPLNLPEVNHKWGIKTDNRVSELEWSTSSKNKEHAWRILGLNYTKKACQATHILTGATYEFTSQAECSRELKLNLGHINNCLRGRSKQHKGYTFQYI
jgi:hypothetical protein